MLLLSVFHTQYKILDAPHYVENANVFPAPIHGCWVRCTKIVQGKFYFHVQDCNNEHNQRSFNCFWYDISKSIHLAVKKIRRWNDYYYIHVLMLRNIPTYLFGDRDGISYNILNIEFSARYSKDNSCWQFIKEDTEPPISSVIYNSATVKPSEVEFIKWISSTIYVETGFYFEDVKHDDDDADE